MRLESGEKIIATGKEPSGIETPAGSSVAPVGSRTWGRGWQPSAAARAMHHAKREARDGEPADMRGNLRAPLGAVKMPRLGRSQDARLAARVRTRHRSHNDGPTCIPSSD